MNNKLNNSNKYIENENIDDDSIYNINDDLNDDLIETDIDALNDNMDILFKELNSSDIDSRKETLMHYYTGTPATAKENKELLLEYNKATSKEDKDRIRDTIVKKNTALVLYYANKWAPPTMEAAIFSDYVQDGFLGLLKAIDKYDINLGYSFATYAVWWIKQRLRRPSMNYKDPIDYPARVDNDIYKIRHIVENYEITHNNETPAIKELSEITGYSTQRVKNALDAQQSTVSLNTYINTESGDDDIALQDAIPDNASEIIDIIIEKESADALDKILKDLLNEREYFILEHRFGLNGKGVHTLQEVGQMLNITRERVRQIERDIMQKIRIRMRRLHLMRKDFF